MTSGIVSFEAPDRRPDPLVQNREPAWTRSAAVAVAITATIAVIGILGGKWIASLVGLFIGWAAVFAVAIIAGELWLLAVFMKRMRERAAAEEVQIPEKPTRRAA